MPLPFSIARSASYYRLPKRKLSGSVGHLASVVPGQVAITCEDPALDDDDNNSPPKRSFQRLSDTPRGLKGKVSAQNAAVGSTSSWRWFCGLCKTVDLRELAGFIVWEALIVLIVALAVADWIFFFKFVVAPDDPSTRAQYGAAWVTMTALLVYGRAYVRSVCGAHVRALAEHAEIFVAVSLVMVFSTNIAFFLHSPSSEPLRDLGFMLIPPQDEHSAWRPLSDLMTALLPIVFMVQSYLMTRENRCRVISTFFRVATVCYALRTLTVSLTSLPGPAPHCRPGNALYSPPKSWLDIITRVGPMYGKFFSCGDLIFSGHMAYTNSAMLLYLRTLDRYFPRFSRPRWLLGGAYMLTLAALCISGRKHYTVDVVLGMMVSTLVFFHFEHGWVPACVQHPEDVAVLLSRLRLAGERQGGYPGAMVSSGAVAPRSKSDMDLYVKNGGGYDAALKRIVVVDSEDDESEQADVADFLC